MTRHAGGRRPVVALRGYDVARRWQKTEDRWRMTEGRWQKMELELQL